MGRLRRSRPESRPKMSRTNSSALAQTSVPGPVPSSRALREGWLHICNGLDPVRDGGMVPSILGMTGALAASGGLVNIVTPTPSRLGDTVVPPKVRLQGPETELESAVRTAEAIHMHGLWQAADPIRGATGLAGGRPLHDRRSRDGRALGVAAEGLEEKGLHRAGRGQRTSAVPPACTRCHARRSAISAPWHPGPRFATSPTGLIRPRSRTCPIARFSRRNSRN